MHSVDYFLIALIGPFVEAFYMAYSLFRQHPSRFVPENAHKDIYMGKLIGVLLP